MPDRHSQPHERFDRVTKPEPGSRPRDREGKEALYSTAPTSAPTRPLEVTCRRCGVTRGLTVREGLMLLKPPFLLNPLTGTMFARCPSCGRRSWLDATSGQALRALLGQRPGTRR
jgi:hypothetical protein